MLFPSLSLSPLHSSFFFLNHQILTSFILLISLRIQNHGSHHTLHYRKLKPGRAPAQCHRRNLHNNLLRHALRQYPNKQRNPHGLNLMRLIPLSSKGIEPLSDVVHAGHAAVAHHGAGGEPVESGEGFGYGRVDEAEEGGGAPDDELAFAPCGVRGDDDGCDVFDEAGDYWDFEGFFWV